MAIGCSLSFGQSAKSKRVLFLGNSVFNSKGGVHQTFEQFCKSSGLNIDAVSQYKEPENPHGVEFLEYGRIPVNLPAMAADEKIHALISSGNFDFVILEGRRNGFLLPEWLELSEDRGKAIPYDENAAALGELHRTIVESGAQTVLYLHPGGYSNPEMKHPVAQIYQRLRADLERMDIGGKQHEVIFVPASFLWLDASRKYGDENWFADPNHGNALARYSSACMLYTYITGLDPRESDFKELPRSYDVSPDSPAEYASEEEAAWIKNQVWLYYSTKLR
jgi:hypothetical protein